MTENQVELRIMNQKQKKINGLTQTNTKGCANQYDLMRISLRTDTNQYDSSRMQLRPVRTDTTSNRPVQTDTTWNGPWRLNRDELLAKICHAHPCIGVYHHKVTKTEDSSAEKIARKKTCRLLVNIREQKAA